MIIKHSFSTVSKSFYYFTSLINMARTKSKPLRKAVVKPKKRVDEAPVVLKPPSSGTFYCPACSTFTTQVSNPFHHIPLIPKSVEDEIMQKPRKSINRKKSKKAIVKKIRKIAPTRVHPKTPTTRDFPLEQPANEMDSFSSS